MVTKITIGGGHQIGSKQSVAVTRKMTIEMGMGVPKKLFPEAHPGGRKMTIKLGPNGVSREPAKWPLKWPPKGHSSNEQNGH